MTDESRFPKTTGTLEQQNALTRTTGQQFDNRRPFLSAVCTVRAKLKWFGPTDRRQLDISDAEATGDPADQLVKLIIVIEWPELVPGTETDRYLLNGEVMQEREADPRIVPLLIPECLPEEVGFSGCTQTQTR